MKSSKRDIGRGRVARVAFSIFNPWNMFMPGYVVMGFLIAAVVLYRIFATFFWRENRGDEREQFHRFFADRIAYLAGSALLLIGIVLGEIRHALDPWLIFALALWSSRRSSGSFMEK